MTEIYELKKCGGSHLRSIKRDIRSRMNKLPYFKSTNELAREVAIGTIRKGDRYVPPKEWEEYNESMKVVRRVGIYDGSIDYWKLSHDFVKEVYGEKND